MYMEDCGGTYTVEAKESHAKSNYNGKVPQLFTAHGRLLEQNCVGFTTNKSMSML